MINTICDDSGVISVEGTAHRLVPYDRVKVEITFQSADTDTFKTMETVLKQSEEFLAVLKDAKVDLSTIMLINEDHSTRRYSDEEESTSERSFEINTGFDIDLLNYLDTLVIKHRWNASISLRFYISNEEEIMQELLQEAVRDSRRQADSAAAAAGFEVKGLKSINLDDSERFMFRRCVMEEDNFAGSVPSFLSSEISAGEEDLKKEVRVKWIVE